jgi:hypothetical protein
MRDENRIVQGLWFYEALPVMQQMSIASFLRRGHEYHLYTYGTLAGAPRGTVLRDAAEILPETEVKRDREGLGFAAFADKFRYKLLLERGGWWVDTDVICLRTFDDPASYVFASEHTLAGDAAVPNNAILKSPAGSAILTSAYEACSAVNVGAVGWAELGPKLMAQLIPAFGLCNSIAEPERFCPVPWFRFQLPTEPESHLGLNPETLAVHLWHSRWRRRGVDPGAAFHPDSVYERWKEELLA